MAEEALEKLEEQLNCSVCLEIFTDPKQLNCNHVFCERCLARVPKDEDGRGKFSLACPTCRQATPVPQSGVAGIQSAFHINNLLEIRASFEGVTIPSPRVKQTAREVGAASEEAANLCFLHPKEELKLYCTSCEGLICLKCALKGGKHQSHEYNELDEAFEKYESEVSDSLKPMEEQVGIVEDALAQLSARHGEIVDRQAVNEDCVHATFRQLREVLDVREAELINQLDKMTREKVQKLAKQREQMESSPPTN